MNDYLTSYQFSDIIRIEKIYVFNEHKKTPGINGHEIIIYSFDNVFAYRQLFECSDKNTMLYFINEKNEYQNGVYRYRARLLSNDPKKFVNPELLKKGCILTHIPSDEETEYNRLCKLRDEGKS